MNDQHTIGDVIRHHAALRPGHPAIVASEHTCLTYRELLDQVDQIRTELREAGYDRSARIAIALPDGPHAALAIVAVACSAMAVPLDPNLIVPEIEARLHLLRPDAIVLLYGASSAARAVAARRRLPILEAVAEVDRLRLRFKTFRRMRATAPKVPTPDTPAFIFQSSGTTAEPKLMPWTHRMMLAGVERLREAFKFDEDDRCLNVISVCYAHGVQGALLKSFLTGGSVAFPHNPSNVDVIEWFTKLRPTWYSSSPTLHRRVLEKIKGVADAKFSHSLRFVESGGGPLPDEVRRGLESLLGIPVVDLYGSGEAGPIATNRLAPGYHKSGTCGLPWPSTVKIVDNEGRQLPPGRQGEIWVRGPTVISGYLDAPELNQEAFIDGWFRTGDVGSLDEDGFLTLHGRLKEVINKGGEKISPAEIDAALQRHPDVAEAAAYPVPHPRLGEDVAAAVVLNPDAVVTPSALQKFLREYLSWSKIPRRIVVLDQLPRGPTGKVQRRQLRESAE